MPELDIVNLVVQSGGTGLALYLAWSGNKERQGYQGIISKQSKLLDVKIEKVENQISKNSERIGGIEGNIEKIKEAVTK